MEKCFKSLLLCRKYVNRCIWYKLLTVLIYSQGKIWNKIYKQLSTYYQPVILMFINLY